MSKTLEVTYYHEDANGTEHEIKALCSFDPPDTSVGIMGWELCNVEPVGAELPDGLTVDTLVDLPGFEQACWDAWDEYQDEMAARYEDSFGGRDEW